MGVELSTQVDPDTPPQTLSRRDLPAVAEFILGGKCQKIVFLCGAGISTSAGIPDFRTPGTGLYSNLQTLNLPHPEAVFDINFFRTNPQPFYTLAKSLHPGQFTPTVTHAFIALTAKKKLLHKCFTQNIDTLERAAGVPPELLVEAHGSFAGQSCIDCHAAYPGDKMKENLLAGSVSKCEVCTGLVKPDIVFFGESLPREFHAGIGVVGEADLVIIMGSSLSVYPFAALPGRAREGAVRVLINNERAGGIGGRADDVIVLGGCDRGVRRLAEELGWAGELEETWKSIGGGSDKQPESSDAVESIDAKVGRLTEEVERSLSVVDGWKEDVMEDLSIQATRINRMVEADLRGEKGEVSLVDRRKLDDQQSSTSSGNDTLQEKPDDPVKKDGSAEEANRS
ncbi:NAD-dependent deacetylase sirtuin-2 [Choiromyces venosus 120613-1]|uniref:NAD-dependent deacetylase sirtuin-2 n=1 Tax=Choiromyces venosus 120613-1 TaxID=1336337 RepID=A0A3N4JTX2_9PEZI|nr:NAD-dependent deacetylase sirtuin-2 [Choiromyces venosus 120613-1]